MSWDEAVDVSVVTIVRDRPRHLRRMLQALAGCTPRPARIVVVDMGEGAADACVGLSRTGVPVDFLRCAGAGPLPLARARNTGAEATWTDRVVFLDVDCLASPDLVGAYHRAPAGTIANAPVSYLREGWHRGWDGSAASLGRRGSHHPARPRPGSVLVDDRHHLLWTLSVGMERRTFDLLGGFDEGYVGYGGEDTDLGASAAAAGVPMAWLPTGVAHHQWHPTSAPPTEHLADIVRNANRFHAKWGSWPMEGWLRAFREMGLVRWDEDGGLLSPAW